MRSDLRALRERIRQVEAGGHRDTPLRRAYNRKLRALKGLKGGGGLPSREELKQKYNRKKDRAEEKAVQQLDGLDPRMQKVAIEVLYKMVRTLQTQVKTLETQVKSLFDTLAADKVESLEDKVETKSKSDSTAHKPSPQAVEDFEQFAQNLYRQNKAEDKHVENQREGRRKSEEKRKKTWR